MKLGRITVNPDHSLHTGAAYSCSNSCGNGCGMNFQEILKSYPDLEYEDIAESLQFAAEAVRERELPLIRAAA